MSYVNGILTVPSYTETGNPGEYTISGATFNWQGDTTGEGAAAILVGFALYVQASDTNTFLAIPGVAHRYKITAVTVIDSSTINATILWDELGPVVDAPTSGVDAIVTSVSPTLKFGYPVDSALYATLGVGMTTGMTDSDITNKTDSLAKADAVVSSVNGKAGAVLLAAGDNVVVDASGLDIVINSTGANEGTFQ